MSMSSSLAEPQWCTCSCGQYVSNQINPNSRPEVFHIPKEPVFSSGPDGNHLAPAARSVLRVDSCQCPNCGQKYLVYSRCNAESGFLNASEPPADPGHSTQEPFGQLSTYRPSYAQVASSVTHGEEPWSWIGGPGSDASHSNNQGMSMAGPSTPSTEPMNDEAGWQTVARPNVNRRKNNIVLQHQPSRNRYAAYSRPIQSEFITTRNPYIALRTPAPSHSHATTPSISSRAESKTASRPGGKRFEDDAYKGWHFGLYKKYQTIGVKSCPDCSRRRIGCKLGHLTPEILNNIPESCWTECPDDDRLQKELIRR